MKIRVHGVESIRVQFVVPDSPKMVVKRTKKVEMPNLKRFKLEELDSEESGCQVNPKKRRENGHYSIGSGSCCGKLSQCFGELQCNSNSISKLNGDRTVLDRVSERVQPPLLRSSRGRSRMLPSRFGDSVLDTLKNVRIKVEDEDSSFIDDSTIGEDVSKLSGIGSVKHEQEKEPDGSEYADSTVIKSRTSLVQMESNTPGLNSEGLDPKTNENAEKRTEIYKLEDFASGDIVWAKCGKRYPAWPAIVIDPILQAPKSVLSCCVPGTICVMFFGYSKNGKQRVSFSSFSWS